MLVTKALSRLLFRCATIKQTMNPIDTQFLQQQPLAGDAFINQSIKRIYKSNKQEVLQLLNLMDVNLMHRNHTLINQACYRLLDFQKQMTKDEIVKIIQICVKAKVYNSAFVQHFQNQLLHKLQPIVNKLTDEHYKIKQVQTQKIWKQLQKNSDDIFEVLIDPEAMKQSETQNESQQINTKQIVLPQMSKEKLEYIAASIRQFGYIGYLLTQLQVQSTNLLKLFKELFLVMGTPQSMKWQTLIQYIRITNHICQKTEQQYQKHKQYYLKRTHKKIKQYQLIFYQRMLPMMSALLPQLKPVEFQALYSEISNYKIKSNGPQTYLLDMYKDYSLKVIKGHNQNLMQTVKTIVSQRPKLIARLKQFDNKLAQIEEKKRIKADEKKQQGIIGD